MTVLVTVVGCCTAADLEVDDTRPVGDLLAGLAGVLGEPSAVAGVRTSDGVDLSPAATLAEAGVVDGQRLMLVPRLTTSARPPALACYLVVDTSDSMAGRPLEALNVEVARLVDAVRSDPRLRDACHVALITFDSEARVHLPLSPGGELGRAPRLAATRPATNYEAAFRFLREQIIRDVDRLRSAGRQPLRPAVFLLTDGRPTRGHWPTAHAKLTDPAWQDAPRVVAFGFGDAAAHLVRRVGVAGAYLPASAPGVAPAAPAGMLATLTTFLLDALQGSPGPPAPHGPRPSAADAGDLGPRGPPAAPPGWRSLDEVRR
jgi:uncharacterized protein YegL